MALKIGQASVYRVLERPQPERGHGLGPAIANCGTSRYAALV
jgi:hypothetical protein